MSRTPGAKTVAEFTRELDHPLKTALGKVRSIILGASPEIADGIKWNSPSFYLKEAEAKQAALQDVVRQWIASM